MFPMIITPILQDRRIIVILFIVGVLQVGMAAAGLRGWQCPIKSVLGISCPGCGLSTAAGLIVIGQWESALNTHAFAFVFLTGLIIIGITAILPHRIHQKIICNVANLERKTGFSTLILAGFLIYWLNVQFLL